MQSNFMQQRVYLMTICEIAYSLELCFLKYQTLSSLTRTSFMKKLIPKSQPGIRYNIYSQSDIIVMSSVRRKYLKKRNFDLTLNSSICYIYLAYLLKQAY